MAKLYSGIINLSKIPKHLIRENRKGEKIIYVDFAERRTPSQYGDTHYIKLYDASNAGSYYIGDFREREFGAKADTPDTDDSLDIQPGDLPF